MCVCVCGFPPQTNVRKKAENLHQFIEILKCFLFCAKKPFCAIECAVFLSLNLPRITRACVCNDGALFVKSIITFQVCVRFFIQK